MNPKRTATAGSLALCCLLVLPRPTRAADPDRPQPAPAGPAAMPAQPNPARPMYMMDPALAKRYGLIPPSQPNPQLPALAGTLTNSLQMGLYSEEVLRDLDGAIAHYRMLIERFDALRADACGAIFRLGECYRKQGRTNDAIAEYNRILAEFSERSDLVLLSRKNLTLLGAAGEEPAVSATAPSAPYGMDPVLARRYGLITGPNPSTTAPATAGVRPDLLDAQLTAFDPATIPDLERKIAFVESKTNLQDRLLALELSFPETKARFQIHYERITRYSSEWLLASAQTVGLGAGVRGAGGVLDPRESRLGSRYLEESQAEFVNEALRAESMRIQMLRSFGRSASVPVNDASRVEDRLRWFKSKSTPEERRLAWSVAFPGENSSSHFRSTHLKDNCNACVNLHSARERLLFERLAAEEIPAADSANKVETAQSVLNKLLADIDQTIQVELRREEFRVELGKAGR